MSEDHKSDASIKALIAQGIATAFVEYEANRGTENSDDSHDSGSGRRTVCTTRKCTYSDFLKCQSLNFKDTTGVVGLAQWFEKMKYVFHISNCTVACQIKFATSTLLGNALMWCNSYVKTVELALMCGRMFPEESDEVKKYVGGLRGMIQGSIRIFDERRAENKRKLDNDNQAQQQPPQKHNLARDYSARSGEKKEYAGTLPLCIKCMFHHNAPCTVKCINCKRIDHLTRDCRSLAATNNQRTLTCYECGNRWYYRSDFSELKNKNHRNQARGAEARGMVYALGGGEIDQDFDNIKDDINA
uniref:CCHC-type domain-containing protein n=1 Tax=Tanacetum cinerariifolium TaxID=118510 RepID=A0A699HKV6_TANCI|nr:hypothetical protein [Tanacetum cinerariifolium]